MGHSCGKLKKKHIVLQGSEFKLSFQSKHRKTLYT